MCGIAGIFERTGKPVDKNALTEMTRILAHRGPDGEGIHVAGPIGLGHRRLSIIDLETGAQPLANEDGSVWTVFNGEIYNYKELVPELQAAGHVFKTHSDTEVIVHAYEEYGVDFLHKLNGMFAIALWDAPRRRLILARDRLGIKPLIFRIDRDRVLFGSEIKAVLRYPGVERRVNPQAIADFFAYRVVCAPETAFDGIQRLEPGQVMVLEEGGEPKFSMYWDYPVAQAAPLTPKRTRALTEELDALISDATRIQLRSDVPLGAFLSGGVDSTAIVYHMADQLEDKPRTFTIGFKRKEEAAFDESVFARDVAERLGANHTEYSLESYEIIELIERLLWFYDEPCATAIPNYFVSQIARKNVTVALSGIGGDEIFAGYARYNPIFKFLDPNESRDVFLRRFLESQSGTLPEEFGEILTPEVMRSLTYPSLIDRYISQVPKDLSKLNACAHIDLKNYLANDLLPYMDSMSMAHSLEVRVPLLDHRIAEFGARLPDEAKVHRGIQKFLLKRTLVGRVPEHVMTREKKGFSLPLAVWLSNLRPVVESMLSKDRILNQGLVHWEPIAQLLRDYYQGGNQSWKNTYRIWSYLILQLWYARFIEQAPAPIPPSSVVTIS